MDFQINPTLPKPVNCGGLPNRGLGLVGHNFLFFLIFAALEAVPLPMAGLGFRVNGSVENEVDHRRNLSMRGKHGAETAQRERAIYRDEPMHLAHEL